jgi:hypothetical protein
MRTKRLSSFAALIFLVSESPQAAPVMFSDGTFNDADWNDTAVMFGGGGTATTSQTSTGGNPGSFREIDITVVANLEARVDIFSINSNAIYDPSASGAIASIDYSEDSILLDTFNTLGGAGQAAAPALLQNGILYSLTLTTGAFGTPDRTWTSHQLVSLTVSDFLSGSLVPDFSASGAPIQFGYRRAISHPPGNLEQGLTGGIDNWSLTVNPVIVPLPPALILMVFGLAGMGSLLPCKKKEMGALTP